MGNDETYLKHGKQQEKFKAEIKLLLESALLRKTGNDYHLSESGLYDELYEDLRISRVSKLKRGHLKAILTNKLGLSDINFEEHPEQIQKEKEALYLAAINVLSAFDVTYKDFHKFEELKMENNDKKSGSEEQRSFNDWIRKVTKDKASLASLEGVAITKPEQIEKLKAFAKKKIALTKSMLLIKKDISDEEKDDLKKLFKKYESIINKMDGKISVSDIENAINLNTAEDREVVYKNAKPIDMLRTSLKRKIAHLSEGKNYLKPTDEPERQ